MSYPDLYLSSSSSADQPGRLQTRRQKDFPHIFSVPSAFQLETRYHFEKDTPYSFFPHYLFQYVYSVDISTNFQLLYDASEKSQLVQNPPDSLLEEYSQLIKYRAAVNSLFSSGQDFAVVAPNFVLEALDFDIFVYSHDNKVLGLCQDIQGMPRMERREAQEFLLYNSCNSFLPSLLSIEPFEFGTFQRPLISVSMSPLGIFRVVCEEATLGAVVEYLLQSIQGDFSLDLQYDLVMDGQLLVVGVAREGTEFLVKCRN